MKITQNILREYDIRGIYPQAINEDQVRLIAIAFTNYLKTKFGKNNVIIATARDGRLSSPSLSESLNNSLLEAGAEIVDVGLGPTPMLYHAAKYYETDGAIMITGSHNPKDHNGLKFYVKDHSFYGEEIKKLADPQYQIISDKAGSLKEIDDFNQIYSDYLTSCLQLNEDHKNLKIALDPGNGAAGEVLELLCLKMNFDVLLINSDIDGTFPAHHPDPTMPENLEQLIAIVKEEGCDVGIAFDGDGDRLGVVDSHGRILFGDQLMQIFAKDILASNPGAKIIADVKSSDILFSEIAKMGGKPIMWKTGHSLIKEKMRLENAQLAGEMSGHIFFAQNYGFDDGLFAAIKLLEILANGEEDLAVIYDQFPKSYSTPEMRIDCSDEIKFKVIDEIKSRLVDTQNVNIIDGVRVTNDNGWWLARASNTQGAIIVRAESASQEGLLSLRETIAKQLSLSGLEI